jgi:hypothetical protein
MNTVSSDQFVIMVDCMKDYITLFGSEYHKLVVAWIVVIFDMISILLIMYFIIKINELSNEYVTIVDDS